jgi:hypothetical protein
MVVARLGKLLAVFLKEIRADEEVQFSILDSPE